MKRIFAILMILALCALLVGCSDDDTSSSGEPTPTPTVNTNGAPTPTPTPAPTSTPFPRVAIENYVLIWKSEPSRGINFMMPTHWKESGSGERYVVYYEPTPVGENGFRVSISNKKKSREPSGDQMRAELKDFVSVLEKSYDGFSSDGKISRDVSFVRFKGYSTYYNYTDEYGVKMKGFVVMSTYNRRIYCMNFCGPEERFEEMLPIGQKILESVSRVT